MSDHLRAQLVRENIELRDRAEAAEAKVAKVEAALEAGTLLDCACGHALDEHNGLGCYARLSYEPFVTCRCTATDDRTDYDLLDANLRAALADAPAEARS